MLNHTCTTLQQGACKACDVLLARWLTETDAHMAEMPRGGDVYSRTGTLAPVSLDSFNTDQAFGDYSADPARRFDYAADCRRAAVALVVGPTSTLKARGATNAVLQSVREAMRAGRADGRSTVGHLGRPDADTAAERADTLRPAMGRADARTADAAIRAAYNVLRTERGRDYGAAAPTGEIGWKAAPARDFRCVAGPAVVSRRLFIVDTAGETTRGEFWPVEITRTVTTYKGKGTSRTRTDRVESLGSANADAVAHALTVRAARTDGTSWAPDASTFAADRFAAALEPVGPVRKSTSNKRKRDGRIGGSAVVTSTPGRGAR